MKYINKTILFFLFQLFCSMQLFSQQEIVLDGIIGVVGDQIVTKSEFEKKYSDMISQGMEVTDNSRCEVMENILMAKLMLNQAKLDSLEVTESQVETEMNRRMRYFINQIGSESALEAYYKKPISQIKEELRKSLRDQLLIQSMQSKVTKDVKVTPEEVRIYYEEIPKDSLPLMNAEVEVAQIVKNAVVSNEAIKEVKEKLEGFKKRIETGEKFSTLAVLYSEDKGSATKGGEIGYVGKAEVEPEFAAAAFQLKKGEVSPIIKTNFGYHIIQLIDRKGTKVNVRHILLKPKITNVSMQKAKTDLDSIALLIKADSMDFAKAALKFSDDEDTKKNGGIMVNPYSAATMTAMDQLDPALFFVIDKMKEGEISNAVEIQDPREKEGYRIIKLIKRTAPHRANLKDDYQKIKEAAKGEVEQKVLKEWMANTIHKTYVKLDDNYSKDCKFMQDWITKKSN